MHTLQTAAIQAQQERAVAEYWRHLQHRPAPTITDTVNMPHGGHRNLHLRRALRLPWPSPHIVMITQAGLTPGGSIIELPPDQAVIWIQTSRPAEARDIANTLTAALSGWTVQTNTTAPRHHIVTAWQTDNPNSSDLTDHRVAR